MKKNQIDILWTTTASLSKMQNIIFLKFWKTQHHGTNPSNVQTGILSTSVKLTLIKYKAGKYKETLTKYQQSGVLLQATGQLSTKQHWRHFIFSLLKKTQSWEISFWLMFWKKQKKKKSKHLFMSLEKQPLLLRCSFQLPLSLISIQRHREHGLMDKCWCSEQSQDWAPYLILGLVLLRQNTSRLKLYVPASAGPGGKGQHLFSLALPLYFLIYVDCVEL